MRWPPPFPAEPRQGAVWPACLRGWVWIWRAVHCPGCLTPCPPGGLPAYTTCPACPTCPPAQDREDKDGGSLDPLIYQPIEASLQWDLKYVSKVDSWKGIGHLVPIET